LGLLRSSSDAPAVDAGILAATVTLATHLLERIHDIGTDGNSSAVAPLEKCKKHATTSTAEPTVQRSHNALTGKADVVVGRTNFATLVLAEDPSQRRAHATAWLCGRYRLGRIRKAVFVKSGFPPILTEDW
jgi:hypothetical protein